ncbi:hypothetical protein GmHk_01G001232 [Glycine max]|nr:hypothetical protein GmHk_01G001232 [Glycine max]
MERTNDSFNTTTKVSYPLGGVCYFDQDHGYSTYLASSSSSSSSCRRISISVYVEVDMQGNTAMITTWGRKTFGQHRSCYRQGRRPHKKKLRTYLGIVACDKVDVTYESWKEVPTAQKDLIWEDIQAEFQIPEASDSRTKKKILQTVGERWRQFKSDLTRKWALTADKDGVDDIDVQKKAQAIQKQNTAPHVLSHGGYQYLEQKLMAEKTKKRKDWKKLPSPEALRASLTLHLPLDAM